MDERAHEDVAAAAAVHTELGRAYDGAVAEGLVERISSEIDKQVDARLAEHGIQSGRAAWANVAMGLGTVGLGTWTVLRRNEEEITRRAGRPIRIIVVEDRLGSNSKVSNLCRLVHEARHNLLVITDSDVRVERRDLDRRATHQCDFGIANRSAVVPI